MPKVRERWGQNAGHPPPKLMPHTADCGPGARAGVPEADRACVLSRVSGLSAVSKDERRLALRQRLMWCWVSGVSLIRKVKADSSDVGQGFFVVGVTTLESQCRKSPRPTKCRELGWEVDIEPAPGFVERPLWTF